MLRQAEGHEAVVVPGLWSHRSFRLLAAAHAVSQVGSQISLVALPLLALVVLHAGAAQVGLLTAADTAGFLLVGLPAGVWVDRMVHKRVMVATDLIRAAALGSIPAAYALDFLALPQLYVVALVAGIATVFFQVAYQSCLPAIVEADRLMEGNTKLQVIYTSAEVTGPGAGGWLVRVAGAPFAVALDAVSFVGSALLLARLPSRTPVASSVRRGLWTEMRQGLSFLLGHPRLRALVASAAIANLFGVALTAMLPVFLVKEQKVGYGTFGTVMACGAIGGLLGAMTTGRQQQIIGSARLLWLNAVLAGLPFVTLIPAAAPGWRLGMAAAGLALDSFFVAAWAVASVSLRQTLTPPALMGRVNATARFLNWGVMPAGAALGGLLAELTSARTTLFVFGTGYIASALPVLLSPGLRSPDTESGKTDDTHQQKPDEVPVTKPRSQEERDALARDPD